MGVKSFWAIIIWRFLDFEFIKLIGIWIWRQKKRLRMSQLDTWITTLQYDICFVCSYIIRITFQRTNISPKNCILKMIFLFPRWDMLIPWRVIRRPCFVKKNALSLAALKVFSEAPSSCWISPSPNPKWHHGSPVGRGGRWMMVGCLEKIFWCTRLKKLGNRNVSPIWPHFFADKKGAGVLVQCHVFSREIRPFLRDYQTHHDFGDGALAIKITQLERKVIWTKPPF